MTGWHPLSKLVLATAVLALPYLAWTALGEAPGEAVPRVVQAQRPPAELASTLPSLVPLPPLPPLEQFAAIVDRPLFSPSRRPAAEAEAAPVTEVSEDMPAPEPGMPDYRLVGTVIQDGRMTALIEEPGAAELIRVETGGEIGDWSVKEIGRNRVVLQRGDEELPLNMLE